MSSCQKKSRPGKGPPLFQILTTIISDIEKFFEKFQKKFRQNDDSAIRRYPPEQPPNSNKRFPTNSLSSDKAASASLSLTRMPADKAGSFRFRQSDDLPMFEIGYDVAVYDLFVHFGIAGRRRDCSLVVVCSMLRL